MRGLERIIMHWTAGPHTSTPYVLDHYHAVIDGEGQQFYGKLKPEANISIADGNYVAHTRNCNTGSIGVAVCAMGRAVERPFNAGPWPITAVQLDAFVRCVAEFAETYSIAVTRRTVLTHAEVQPTLGVRQAGKWDIAWLPGMERPGDPIEVGDRLRAMVSASMGGGAAERPDPLDKQVMDGLETIEATTLRLKNLVKG